MIALKYNLNLRLAVTDRPSDRELGSRYSFTHALLNPGMDWIQKRVLKWLVMSGWVGYCRYTAHFLAALRPWGGLVIRPIPSK